MVLDPLLRKEDRLTGMHANTQIPKVIGFKRIADLEGNNDWSDAARYFWETVVRNRSITIGGNSVREHFHPADNFESMLTSEQGPETCNTYNMLRLTKMLYETTGEASFMDYYERTLYNHILSTQDPVQGGFVYFTPMRSGHYRVYSQPQTSFWCCVGSGLENHARYGEMIYGHYGDKALYVNLFIPSTLKWGNVEIEQQTTFPEEEGTTIVVNPRGGKKRFALMVRLPEWTDAKVVRCEIDGKECDFKTANGYIIVERAWTSGERLHVNLPMQLRAIGLPDKSDNYSFLYGPIVLAARMGTQQQDGMFADDSRGGHIANGPRLPLQNMPVVVGDKETLLSHLQKTDGKLTFKLSGVRPDNYEEMTLEPFYRIHESRYMVYWPLMTEEQWTVKREQQERSEREALALESRTADKVICGEQQPESDHFVKMEAADRGDDEGTHWRDTRAWFSYTMKTGGKATKVRISFRQDANRDARILVDDVEIGTIAPDCQSPIELTLPQDKAKAERITIKVARGKKAVTPHIYEVRVMDL